MTDERLCKCGHAECDHSEGQEMDLDGRPTSPPYPYCYECQVDDRDDSDHPFEAAPSTDEGEARLSGLWFQYRMGLDGDLPRIRQEIEAAIRDPLEERITKANEAKEAFRQLSLDLAREKTAIHEKWIHEVELRAAAEERIRDLEAQVASFQYGHDMHCEAKDEVERLREAVIWMSGSADFGPGQPAHEHWVEIRDTLLFPLSSTEGTE